METLILIAAALAVGVVALAILGRPGGGPWRRKQSAERPAEGVGEPEPELELV